MEREGGLKICGTCGKKGEHWTFECPGKNLAPHAETSLNGSPSADGPAVSPKCSVCKQAVDRYEANALRQRADLMRRRAEAERCGNGADVPRRNDETSIRVTNLPENTSQRDLYNLGGPFGLITNAELGLDEQTGSPRQFGIVSFARRSSAEKAISWLDGYSYGGLTLKAEWKTPTPKDVHVPSQICAVCVRDAESAIRVTNLPENACQRDLYNLAGPFGVVTRVYLALDEKDGSGKQFGIVKFCRRKSAEVAISRLEGYAYDMHNLQAELATPNDLVVFYSATN